MSISLDIDLPTKHFGIHHVNKSRNPKFKGINELLRDGGWFELDSKEEAYKLYISEYPRFTLENKTD